MLKSIYTKTGIYCIENIVNEKKYIGKGKNITTRWSDHKWKLKNKIHDNKHLQNAWDKYGEENFKLWIIEECKESELIEKEIFYISLYNTKNTGYNMTDGGDGIPGHIHSEETKIKMSNSQKGKKQTKEQIKKRKNTIINWTDDQKEIAYINRSNGHKNHIVLEKTKEKLSEYFKNNPSRKKGEYKHSEETKKKLSESLKRYWLERRTQDDR